MHFEFAENPFFSDKTLTKKYFMADTGAAGANDFVFDHAEGSTINWNKDKALTHTVETKKQRHKCTFFFFVLVSTQRKESVV